MPTPTMSLRALPEHHQLIRRMARALIERPDLAELPTALIGGATQAVPQDAPRPNPAVDQRFEDIERRLEQVERQTVLRGDEQDVLPATQPAIQDLLLAIQQRQLRQEETTRKVMAFAQSINDGVVKDRQARAEAPPQHTIVTQPPRKPSGQGRRSPRPWTDADDAQLRRIFDQGGTQADACRELDRPSSVISPKWWKLAEATPAKAEANEQPAGPASHVDENPETPIESNPAPDTSR